MSRISSLTETTAFIFPQSSVVVAEPPQVSTNMQASKRQGKQSTHARETLTDAVA